MDSSFYKDELYKMQSNYKNNPLRNLNLSRPDWLDFHDPMSRMYEEKSTILQQGKITYACIVQANNVLFHRFPAWDCPAQIVYSTNSHIDENPKQLYSIASKIFSYKDQPEDNIPDEWKDLAGAVTDEKDRNDFTFALNIDGQSAEYRMIPTIIHRKLLPKKKLCGNILPILTAPECSQVLILPKKYWTKSFKEVWVKGII